MFKEQAELVLQEGIERKPTLNFVDKKLSGDGHDEVHLVELPITKGGMMLFTSGTTSRPVNFSSGDYKLLLSFQLERRHSKHLSIDSSS